MPNLSKGLLRAASLYFFGSVAAIWITSCKSEQTTQPEKSADTGTNGTRETEQVESEGGGLTQQEIMGVIRNNLNQIKACYEQTLRVKPSLSGKIKVRFIINSVGNVSLSEIIESTINDQQMETCVRMGVASWRFPASRNAPSVTVRYPFVFNPA